LRDSSEEIGKENFGRITAEEVCSNPSMRSDVIKVIGIKLCATRGRKIPGEEWG
jgi:hypothetical protein